MNEQILNMKPTVPYQSLNQIITRHAYERSDKIYGTCAETGRSLSFAQLDAVTSRMGHFFAARGFKIGDRVSVLSENCLSQMCFFHGIQRYGATVSLVNCDVNAKNVQQILHDVGPKLIVYHRETPPELLAVALATGAECLAFTDHPVAEGDNEFFNLIEQYPSSRDVEPLGTPNDIALINYTSGTTSRPKGVCYSHSCFFYIVDSAANGFDIHENDRVLECRAMTWISSQILSISPTLQVGASFVLARKFSSTNLFNWIRDYGITISIGVPTIITMLMERPHALTKAELPTLRYMTTSSAPITPETYKAFQTRYGITLVQAMGMSESGFIFVNDPSAPRLGPVGLELRNLRARFVDQNDNDTLPNVEGELMLDGPQIFNAYLLSNGEIQPRPPGGFRTGDLGHYDQDGYAWITGRKKDLIIRGGVNISPQEITSYLSEHPAVLEAATIGIPDNIYGEGIACFVVPKPGVELSVEEMTAHMAQRVSGFKMPQSITLLESIPKLDRGKVSKDGLLQIWNIQVKLTHPIERIQSGGQR